MGKKYFFGSTLIELIIFFVILILIAVIVVTLVINQIPKSRDTARKADIERIKTALENYKKDLQCYPSYIVCGRKIEQPIYPYLNNVPCDPVTGAAYEYEFGDSYTCPGSYKIYTVLEDGKDSYAIPNIGPHKAFNYITGSSGGSATSLDQTYYGWKDGKCVPVIWNSTRPGPECDPYWAGITDCGLDYSPSKECVPWR